MSLSNKKILVTVPAYNESKSIAGVVDNIRKSGVVCDVLVINDGSTDQTALASLRIGSLTASLPFNLGIGGAVQTGFQYAEQKDYDVAIQFDGDGQHDAQFLSTLIDPILNDQADMVIGSRFLPPFLGYQSSIIRRVGINFFSWLISFLTGIKITDPTSGFRACNRKVIKVFAENYPLDFPEPEAIVVAKKHNIRIVEVPVCMKERLFGRSSIRYLKTFYYMVKVTFAILLQMIKKN